MLDAWLVRLSKHNFFKFHSLFWHHISNYFTQKVLTDLPIKWFLKQRFKHVEETYMHIKPHPREARNGIEALLNNLVTAYLNKIPQRTHLSWGSFPSLAVPKHCFRYEVDDWPPPTAPGSGSFVQALALHFLFPAVIRGSGALGSSASETLHCLGVLEGTV